MADLNPLIRLNKFRLEEKQRAISKLYNEVEGYEIQKKAILDSVESEKGTVDEDFQNIHLMQAFMNYVQRSKQQTDDLNNKISSLEIRIGRMIDEMRDAFGELKKIEITRDRRLEELAEENKRREDALFSEIALEIYRRQS